MATESPMRMVESSRKWPSSKDPAAFGFPLRNMAAEQSRLLLKEQRFLGDQAEIVPNRSGSAPPSMEGSLASIKNLLMQHNSSLNSSLANYVPEEQLCSDPAFGNNWSLTSVDDCGNGSFHLSRGSLSTHREESEDDTSPRPASNNLTESSNTHIPGQNTASLASRHKSLVDLIQEDFPRTPSPVYSHSRSSGPAALDGPFDSDVHAISLNVSSIDTSKQPELNSGCTDVSSEACAPDAHAFGLVPDNNPVVTSFTSSRCPDKRGSSPAQENSESNDKDAGLKDDASISGALGPDGFRTDSKTRASDAESDRNKQEEPLSYKRNMVQHYPAGQWRTQYQVQGFQAQVSSQGTNHSRGVMEKVHHSHPNFSSVEVQPSLHSPGFTPPVYQTAATYMTSGNPYYPNYYPSGLFAPQYSVGGYALSSAHHPPYMAAYSSHGAIPLPFDATSGPSFSGGTAGPSTGEGIPLVGDPQYLRKIYGQHGLVLQPSFVDSHHMLCYPQPIDNAYNTAFHSRLAPAGVIGSQVDPFALQKESTVASYMSDQKLYPPTNGSLSILSPGKIGTSGSSYFPSPPNLDVMTQLPPSPLPSPLLPSSPVGGMNHVGWQNEMRFPQSLIRNAGLYPGWQGRRGLNNFDDSKRHSLLEELRSSNARKFELSDIAGRIVEFSVDQHGSRFIQQKLEHCSVEDKASVFKEVLPHASKLMIDVFGNYVIQKFFEHGSLEQRKELADQLAGRMLSLSLQMYGCRVIQKALDVIELDQKIQLVHELDGHVMRCVRDQNGNHVIQKCIECIPAEKIGFIISAFRGQVAMLSTHPYGCRVIQRVLEHCSDELQVQCVMDEILESAYVLAQDQYGNYVTQHVLEMGKPHARSQIIRNLTGTVVTMSQHKYASNVVEKCLEHGDTLERELLIEEIIGQSEDNDNLLIMMKDQFANYVVQKILEISNDKQREILLNRIRVHLHALKKYTYGKHIVARFEQLFGEESQALES
ncbi:hypothetical protein FH972_003438 [Carpinus fangiana]|uniref:PUM-HD domain-containing protein n=1 Tax=Carpinus fangiana TaxID=176857 RepID=A0A5N6QIG7_9ROSI|nr:hypothetical protein FH972_003438 [Carpinus fangiana]